MIILTNLPGVLQWSINYFSARPDLLYILKPFPPGWIQKETKNLEKSTEQKKEAFNGPAAWPTRPIVHDQTWAAGPSSGRWFSKQAGGAPGQQLAACTPTCNNARTGLCTHLINGSPAPFAPKLAGASWMFFLTLYQKCNWQPAPSRQCNMTCSFKEPLISIPSPFWDTIAYFYTLNTVSPVLGEHRKRDPMSVGAFEYEEGEICKCSCF